MRKGVAFRIAANRALDYETGLMVVHTLSLVQVSFTDDDV
jgi:hypothetical protein